MSFKATVLNVMIASPSDVATERENVRSIIHSWNATYAEDRQLVLLPSGWESHSSPQMGDRAQAIINKQLLDPCDLLVAIFWTRLGSPTGDAASGTVEEINKHLANGKPAMIYFSNAPVRPDSVDEAQYRALREFRKQCEKRGLIETYSSIEEFRDKFGRQLAQTVMREFKRPVAFAEEEIRSIVQELQVPGLSTEAQQLLLECAEDPHGTVMCVGTLAGSIIQTNGKQFGEQGDPRSEAKWKSAIEELLNEGLLDPRSHKGEVFGMTGQGYDVADRLRQKG